MVQLKARIFYMSYHCRSADRLDFSLNCITATASSTSIAGWAIWQSHGFAWGLIIAVSQVIKKTMAIKKGVLEVVNKHFSSIVLPRNQNYERLATEDAKGYFNTVYFKGNENG
jgi:hypothetical protein